MAWIAGELVNLRAWEREDVRAAWEATQSPDGRGERLRDWHKPPKALRAMEAEFDAALVRPDATLLEFIIDVDGRAVGDIDFFRLDVRNRNTLVGLGIWRAEDRGKGYGSDALRALLRWGFAQLNLHRVELNVDVENAPALHVYEKLGFVVEGRQREKHFGDGRFQDELTMAVLRRDFEAGDHGVG